MVLVKRKLQRQQLCRGVLFRKLLALVYDPEDAKKTYHQTKSVAVLRIFSEQKIIGFIPQQNYRWCIPLFSQQPVFQIHIIMICVYSGMANSYFHNGC